MSKKQLGYIGAAPTQSFKNFPKKYNPTTRKHEIFIEKKLPPHSK